MASHATRAVSRTMAIAARRRSDPANPFLVRWRRSKPAGAAECQLSSSAPKPSQSDPHPGRVRVRTPPRWPRFASRQSRWFATRLRWDPERVRGPGRRAPDGPVDAGKYHRRGFIHWGRARSATSTTRRRRRTMRDSTACGELDGPMDPGKYHHRRGFIQWGRARSATSTTRRRRRTMRDSTACGEWTVFDNAPLPSRKWRRTGKRRYGQDSRTTSPP